jgi:hypothetical protein
VSGSGYPQQRAVASGADSAFAGAQQAVTVPAIVVEAAGCAGAQQDTCAGSAVTFAGVQHAEAALASAVSLLK